MDINYAEIQMAAAEIRNRVMGFVHRASHQKPKRIVHTETILCECRKCNPSNRTFVRELRKAFKEQ